MNPDELLTLGRELVDIGSKRGVTLRLLGSLAVRNHISGNGKLLDLMERVPTHDIDFMGYSKEQSAANKMFKELGYQEDPSVAFSLEYGIQRLIYHHRNQGVMAEIFLDELRMAHTLDFRGRLELDYPTISLIDLLLSKLQIHKINEKDIKDMIALLAEHDLGAGDPEFVDMAHMLKLTSKNWGLYYTATKNLTMMRQFLERYPVINTSTRQNVANKIDQITHGMESTPKSLRWTLRSMIGTRMRWYEEVGDVHR